MSAKHEEHSVKCFRSGNTKLETLAWLQHNGLPKAKAAAWKTELRTTRESFHRHGSAKWKHTISP